MENDTESISIWLTSLGLSRYKTSFDQNGISSRDLLVHLTKADLVELRVFDEKDQNTILSAIQQPTVEAKMPAVENFQGPLMNLLEHRIISAQDIQMMFGVLKQTIKVSSHIRDTLEAALHQFASGSIQARAAGDVVLDVRRHVARVLGLTDDDLLHPSYAPAAAEADIQSLKEEIRKNLCGRRDQARVVFACMDIDDEGLLPIDTFVSTLADLLPLITELRRLRKFARRLDREDSGCIAYEAFLEQYSTAAVPSKQRSMAGRSTSPFSSDEDDILIQRFAGRNNIVRLSGRRSTALDDSDEFDAPRRAPPRRALTSARPAAQQTPPRGAAKARRRS